MGKINGKVVGIGLAILSVMTMGLNMIKENNTRNEIVEKSAEKAANIVMEKMTANTEN